MSAKKPVKKSVDERLQALNDRILRTENGKRVRLYTSSNIIEWLPHPRGVVIRQGNNLLLNGIKKIGTLKKNPDPDDSRIGFDVAPDGAIITLDGKTFYRNGERLCSTSMVICGWSGRHANGIVIHKKPVGNKTQSLILLRHDGKEELLYRGAFYDWGAYSTGVIVEKKKVRGMGGRDAFIRVESGSQQVIERTSDLWEFHYRSGAGLYRMAHLIDDTLIAALNEKLLGGDFSGVFSYNISPDAHPCGIVIETHNYHPNFVVCLDLVVHHTVHPLDRTCIE